MSQYILGRQPDAIQFNSRVTAVSLVNNGGDTYMEVVAGDTYQFSHVISTLTPRHLARFISDKRISDTVRQSLTVADVPRKKA